MTGAASDAVYNALSTRGLAHVHTAYDYFNLPGVADGLARSRKQRYEYFITGMTSPCVHPKAPPMRNVTDPAACYELTMLELNATLTSLSTPHVDLMLLHGPSEPFGYLGGCDKQVCELNQAQWRAYQDFYLAGGAWAIGVSNFCQSCLECLMQDNSTNFTPAVNQIQMHVGTGPDPEHLPSYCDAHGIIVQAYSPLAAGEVVSDSDCVSVGKRHNVSAAQVGLQWVLQRSAHQTLVVKSSKPEYLQEDVAALELVLTAEDVSLLDAKTSPLGQQDGRPSWGCAE